MTRPETLVVIKTKILDFTSNSMVRLGALSNNVEERLTETNNVVDRLNENSNLSNMLDLVSEQVVNANNEVARNEATVQVNETLVREMPETLVRVIPQNMSAFAEQQHAMSTLVLHQLNNSDTSMDNAAVSIVLDNVSSGQGSIMLPLVMGIATGIAIGVYLAHRHRPHQIIINSDSASNSSSNNVVENFLNRSLDTLKRNRYTASLFASGCLSLKMFLKKK